MTLCIPRARGVPGFSNEPPYWLPGHTEFSQNTSLDDPRWRGAFRRNFNDLTVFRALHHVEGSVTSLYLSWIVDVEQLDDVDDALFVGFRPGGGGDGMVIHVRPHGTVNVASPPAPASSVNNVDVYTGSGGSWSSLASEPAWIASGARMWVDPLPDSSGTWAVQMIVPVDHPGSSSLTDDDGPDLGTDFDLWFLTRGGAPGSFPVLVAEFPNLMTSLLDLQSNDFPAPASWEDALVGTGDPACPTAGGIELERPDVGTTNSPSSDIRFDGSVPVPNRPVNTFFARPRNYTRPTGSPEPAGAFEIGAGELTARFRLANWGSIADPTTWVDLPGGAAVQNATPIPEHDPTTPHSTTNHITFDWRLDDGDIGTFVTGSTPHKCILVTLDGPFTFFNDSVYRNMDFVEASRFARAAEISVAGLGPAPTGAGQRDVYLSIHKRNMPDRVEEDAEAEPQKPDRDFRRARTTLAAEFDEADVADRVLEMGKAGQLPDEIIEQYVPTYLLRVYYDTGERVTRDGRDVPVLRPQTHFGYYVDHEGALVGWRDELDAPASARLEEVAPDFYKIVVPDEGTTTVRNVVVAAEDESELEGDELPEGCRRALRQLIRRIFSLFR